MNSLELTACCLTAAATAILAVAAISAILGRPVRSGRGQPLTRADGWFMLGGVVFLGCQALSIALGLHGGSAATLRGTAFVAAVPWIVHLSLRSKPGQPPRPGQQPSHD